ncbi:MAG: glycosyltransferase [Proteobacteria bacterium]|nr:glycosyltransferase [Pseudomonadota bacterium]
MLAKMDPVQLNKAPRADELPLRARALILSPDLSNAAMGRFALDLALRVRAEGGTPLIAAPGGLLKLELQRQKIDHCLLPDPGASALGHMLAAFQLSRWVAEQRATFMHVLDFSLARLAYEVMVKTGARAAITLNQPVISALSSRDGGTLRNFDRIVVPSTIARTQLLQQLQLSDFMVRTIIPGININVVHFNRIGPHKIATLEKNWQLPDDRPVVVVPDCPLDVLMFDHLTVSLQELKRKGVYTVLFVPPAERTTMLQRVAKHGLASHVITASNPADRIPALWLAHAVLVTGFRGQESLLSLIEAQAMGRPVVAFDRNGLSEILLRDDATTLLAAEDMKTLSKALEKTLALTSAEREDFARRARAFVEENFDARQMVDDVMSLYRDLATIQN